jgi:endonuclease/exonuclease/phosphatase family metal-dependent hydrolase
MTWNVLYGAVATRLGGWDVRGPAARDVIVAESPDVLALQEIDAGQLDFARAGVPGYVALVGEPSGVSSYPRHVLVAGPLLLLAAFLLSRVPVPVRFAAARELLIGASIFFGVLGPLVIFVLESYRGPFKAPGEYAPILYRPDRVRPLGEGTVWISDTPDRPGSTFPLLFEPRILRWARFAFVGEGPEERTFLLIAVHFGHAPWHYAGTARIVLDLLARHRIAPDEPAFVMGDFNASPVTGVFKRLVRPRGPFLDARRAAAQIEGPGQTFQWNLSKNAPPLDLDHILFVGAATALRARVLTPRPQGLTITDHDPVVGDFEI